MPFRVPHDQKFGTVTANTVKTINLEVLNISALGNSSNVITFDSSIIFTDVIVNDLIVNGNAIFNGSSVTINSTTTTIGNADTDDLIVIADANFQNNVILGTNSTDTLTVNAVSTFNSNATFNGTTTTIGNAATDDLVVVADADFQNNVILGTDATDNVTVNGVTTFNGNVVFNGASTTINSSTIILGDANTDTLTVGATATFNGNRTTFTTGTTTPNAATAGYVYSGTVSNPAVNVGGAALSAIAGGSRTLNGKVGKLSFTNVGAIGAPGSDTIVILNNAAGSDGLVNIEIPAANTNSNPVLGQVTWSPGVSISVTVTNLSGATGTGAWSVNFTFISYN